MTALGGQVLYQDPQHATARAEVAGQTIWLGLYSQQNEIQLDGDRGEGVSRQA